MLTERIAASRLRALALSGSHERRALPLAAMPRLAELLAGEQQGNVTLDGRFVVDAADRLCLEAELSGELWLACQRCLGAVRWPVQLAVRLVVVEDEAAAQALDDPFDSLLLEAGELPLFRAMEDELLAAAPLAPRHAKGAACRASAAGDGEPDGAAADTHRPFAGLQELLARGR